MKDIKKSKEGNNEIREEETNIIKGARQTDQLEKLKPQSEAEKNNRTEQAGASPIKHINKGEQP